MKIWMPNKQPTYYEFSYQNQVFKGQKIQVGVSNKLKAIMHAVRAA